MCTNFLHVFANMYNIRNMEGGVSGHSNLNEEEYPEKLNCLTRGFRNHQHVNTAEIFVQHSLNFYAVNS